MPRLDPSKGAHVDIGFLGGEDHRRAFASLFAKLLADNPSLTEASVERIEAERTVAHAVGAIAELDVQQLALALYDSHNEVVFLGLAGPGGRTRLGVRFDNPEFWVEDPAA